MEQIFNDFVVYNDFLSRCMQYRDEFIVVTVTDQTTTLVFHTVV